MRMSQYQRAVHVPRFNIAQNLAKALDVPVECATRQTTKRRIYCCKGTSSRKRSAVSCSRPEAKMSPQQGA